MIVTRHLVAMGLGALAALTACPAKSSDNPDGQIADVCTPHASCDDCLADFNDSCVWCAGACQVSPTPKDSGKWCAYGYADETTPMVCTENNGGALLPTTLSIDCRSAKNTADPRCAGGTIGTGPIFPTGIGSLGGGYIDTANNRVVIGAFYNNSNTDMRHGAVIAVDLTSGNRTDISATYVDGQQSDVAVGTGPDLPGVVDVKPSPNGMTLYAVTGYAGNKGRGIFKIDPTTGARTVLYDGTTTQCTFAAKNWPLIDVVSGPGQTIAVGPDGTLYVPTGSTADGNGIATVSPSGTCTILSMASQNTTYKKGTGPIPYSVYSGLVLVGNTLYAESMAEVHSIDITTGNRKLVSASRSSPPVGTGPDLADGYMTLENTTTLLSSGPSTVNGSEFHTYTDVDIATGNRTPHDKVGGPIPPTLNSLHWFAPYPAMQGILLAVTSTSVDLYEPSSGASVLISN